MSHYEQQTDQNGESKLMKDRILLNSRLLMAAFAMTSLIVIPAGCAVGPDFRPPHAPSVDRFTAEQLPDKTIEAQGPDGASQKFVVGKDIPSQWWTLFRSEALDRLIRQALTGSPTLELAKARLRVAQENHKAQAGTLFPSVDANLSATRQKVSGASFGQPDTTIDPFTLINASVNVSYSLDIFGGTRRQVEALQSQVEYQQFQLEGAHLTLASNVVTTVVKEASLRMQIQATSEIITLLERNLEIVEKRLDIGVVSRSDVLTQVTQLSQAKAALPPLARDLAQTRNQLSVLIGKMPGESQITGFDLDEMQLPSELPVSLPSELVRQRPDIRSAEALLHAACAQVGVATAKLYPQITLSASYGSMATTLTSLFDGPSTVYNFGASLLQPLFHGGALSAQKRAAIAFYDQSMAQYRETVLESFQNVADVLQALETGAQTLKAQNEVEEAARNTLELTERQFELGAVSFLSLLTAQRQYQDARISLIRARAARFADTAALFQALGGGWWNRSYAEDSIDAASKERSQ
jgi:NodT family efflux transporter outer membrane factor (OMF) lipoprotein